MAARLLRLLPWLLLATLATTTAAEEAAPTEAEAEAETQANEATPEPEPLVINCKPAELQEPIDTWSVDCVAQWLDNMGHDDLQKPFMANGINGTLLREMTLEKLESDYGVADESARKKLVYVVKDIVKKDSYKGNTNNWAQFFMWALPFVAIYKWLTVRYERQISRMTKKYQKWQDARTPVEAPPPAAADATNEWISGVNADVGTGHKKEKRTKKAD